MPALVLTYHAIESGPPPLCVDPELFARHLEVIAGSGARVVSAGELATLARAGFPEENLVAITFDDGFASVASSAVPLLRQRELPATIYFVAGKLGARSDWSSARAHGFVGELATEDELAHVAALGIEIGSHGFEHVPLVAAADRLLEREVVESRRVLEQISGQPVPTFALPYGARPGPAARRLLEGTYEAVFTTTLGRVEAGAEVYSLPRVDAHYVRRPELLRRALAGRLGSYFQLRAVGARVRRTVTKDYRVS